MKIKEVVTEAGVLSTIGRGLAGAATGAIRMLDKVGGGTGDVGTQAQRDAYKKKEYARARATVGEAAFDEFADFLEQNNINLQDPDSYDPVAIKNYLKNFARNYFEVSDGYHTTEEQQQAIRDGVQQGLERIPLPTKLNNISVQDYLEKANTVRTLTINQVDKMTVTQKTASPSNRMQALMVNEPTKVLKTVLDRLSQQTNPTSEVRAVITQIQTELTRRGFSSDQQPAAPAASPLPTDLTVVSSSPVVLRYRNQDFALTDDDRWVRFGTNKLVSPEMEAYLNRQLEKL